MSAEGLLLAVQISRLQKRAGADGDRFLVFQHLLDDGLGEAARRLAHVAFHQGDDTVRKGEIGFGFQQVFGGHALAHEHEGEIAHGFCNGRHLDHVAEHLVHVGIGLGDLVPAFFETHGAGLRLEVGELAAGHFVQVDLGGGALHAAFKGGVMAAHGFPIVRDFTDGGDVEAGVAVVALQRLDHGADGGLAGVARKRVHRAIDGVDARLGGGEDRGRGDACRVVGVEVDGEAGFFLQRLHQRAGGGGFDEAAHVLEAQDMGAGFLKVFRHFDVVLQVVLGAVRVVDVAGVADRPFEESCRCPGRRPSRRACSRSSSGGRRRGTGPCRLAAARWMKNLDDVVGIVGVADAIGPAHQHLRQKVRHGGAQVAQALPGAFLQEAVGDIEGRTAPAFHR